MVFYILCKSNTETHHSRFEAISHENKHENAITEKSSFFTGHEDGSKAPLTVMIADVLSV